MNYNEMAKRIHKLNYQWWHDIDGNRLDRNAGELLMLVVTELSEGVEGLRKNLMDDHLPHRKMIEVELADAAIRLFDFAGGFGLELPGNEDSEACEFYMEENEAEILLQITAIVVDIYGDFCAGFSPGITLEYALELIFQYGKNYGYDVAGAIEEKLEYNQKRADHKIENRMKEGGKKF